MPSPMHMALLDFGRGSSERGLDWRTARGVLPLRLLYVLVAIAHSISNA